MEHFSMNAVSCKLHVQMIASNQDICSLSGRCNEDKTALEKTDE